MKSSITLDPSSSLRSLMTVFLYAALLSLALAGTNAQAGSHSEQQPDIVKITPSPKSFPETLDALRKAAGDAGWSILNENNMAGVLSERGFTLDPVMIIDVCSGQYSARILENDDYRPVSAFMPCRISVYQDSQGQVFIARMNVPAFLPMMPEGVAEVMEQSDNEIAEIIERAVSQ